MDTQSQALVHSDPPSSGKFFHNMVRPKQSCGLCRPPRWQPELACATDLGLFGRGHIPCPVQVDMPKTSDLEADCDGSEALEGGMSLM